MSHGESQQRIRDCISAGLGEEWHEGLLQWPAFVTVCYLQLWARLGGLTEGSKTEEWLSKGGKNSTRGQKETETEWGCGE